jgi:hypothetical protein
MDCPNSTCTCGSSQTLQLHLRHVSGRVTDVFYNASVYQDDEGNMLGVFAARHDLTQRKPAEVKQRADDGPTQYRARPIAV